MDPIDLEIWNHRLASVAEEMGTALMCAAFSANIKERRDFSCAIFDADGHMVAQAAHIPVHLGSAPMSVQAVARAVPLGPGEAGIVNDPFAGGTHLPDITLVEPVYLAGEEKPSFWVANRAHHADVGGVTPGSMPIARHIDEEGVRIPPSRLTPELEAAFLERVRGPRERRGDLAAQRAANRIGIVRLEEIAAEWSVGALHESSKALFCWSERLMGEVLSSLRPGVYHARDVIESDGLGTRDIPIDLVLTLGQGRVIADFSGSAKQVRGPVNAVRAIAVSAVAYSFRCLAGPELPSNDGFMQLIDVVTRPGSVVDALAPAAVGAGNVETSQRLADVIWAALAQAAPERLPASSCGSMNNVLFGGITPAGAEFTYYETLAGGSGGSPTAPGESGVHTHMTNTLNTPVEVIEHGYPVRIETYAIRRGSGGDGLHAGGEGVVRRYRFLQPAEVTLLGERRERGAPGLAGGGDGSPGEDWWMNEDGTVRLPSKVHVDVAAGDAMEIRTPGGGGWGSPRAASSEAEEVARE